MSMLATRLPGPPELLPGLPDAIVDLQTDDGVDLVGGQWRYHDARVTDIDFVHVGDDLGPSGPPNRTFDIEPHAEPVEFDDSAWDVLAPADTMRRLSTGRNCFIWYRLSVTIPERIGEFATTGSTAVFEVVIDDCAEVWVNGQMPLVLGQTGGQTVAGFNAPNRVVLGQDVRPGQRFLIAVFGINGPLSASPRNYIWMRSATLDFYSADRARAAWPAALEVDRVDPGLEAILPASTHLEQVAGGFVFTEGRSGPGTRRWKCSAPRATHPGIGAGAGDRQGVRGLLVLGSSVRLSVVGGPPGSVASDQSRF
jgi:gluconolactonase